MDKEFVDYFDILQVHFNAEPMIIKAAYRKLCQKYHPDNQKHHSIFALINEAYDVLSDMEKRTNYTSKWFAHYNTAPVLTKTMAATSAYDFSVLPLKKLVNSYMTHIKNKEYEQAYGLLSQHNKSKLFKKDYIYWQRLVARVHQIEEVDASLNTQSDLINFKDSFLGQHKFLVFQVRVVEKSLLLDKYEEDFFNRIVVCEEGRWSIYLPNKNIKKIIKKYERITGSHRENRSTLLHKNKHSQQTYNTGLVSKIDFLKNCEHEHLRYKRYKSRYSVMCLTFHGLTKDLLVDLTYEIESVLRILDSLCLLKQQRLMILLPETGERSLEKVQKKIIEICKIDRDLAVVVTLNAQEQIFESVKELLGKVMEND